MRISPAGMTVRTLSKRMRATSLTLLTLLLLCAAPSCQSGERVAPMSQGLIDGIAFTATGRGPAIVLLHGSNLDSRMWNEDVAWLSRTHRVITIDLRGHGRSPTPTMEYASHLDVIRVLDSLGITSTTILGLSSGAETALEVAAVRPSMAARLILVSPSVRAFNGQADPDSMPPFLKPLSAALRAGDRDRAIAILLASPIMAVPPIFDPLVHRMVVENQRLWDIPYELALPIEPSLESRLRSIHVEALVLVGDQDIQPVRSQAILLGQHLPRASVLTIPGGGHLLNLTSPSPFRSQLRAFMGMTP